MLFEEETRLSEDHWHLWKRQQLGERNCSKCLDKSLWTVFEKSWCGWLEYSFLILSHSVQAE